MAVITLLSDWNYDNLYCGLIKAKLYTLLPDLKIIDFNHQITPFNSGMAATSLRLAVRQCPAPAIHLLLTNTVLNGNYPLMAIKNKQHYVIGVDKKIFTLVFDEFPETAVIVDTSEFQYNPTFPELDIFPVLAAFLAKGGDISELGSKVDHFTVTTPYMPVITDNNIIGHIIFIDTYSNAITNISEEQFTKIRKERDFEITFRSPLNKITRISPYYEPARETTLQAVFNSAGLLELASYNAKLCELHDLSLYSEINIRFYDNKNS